MAQEVLADVLERGVCIPPDTGKETTFEGRIIFTNNKSLPELVRAKRCQNAYIRC